MKIRPLHDRVIVKREEEERKSAGGILIPDMILNISKNYLSELLKNVV